MSIATGSPAAVAGLQVGDTIVAFNGTAVTGVDALHRLLTADHAGERTELTVLRLTQKLTLAIVPAERRDAP
jgi:S1-C subfamily serine protease